MQLRCDLCDVVLTISDRHSTAQTQHSSAYRLHMYAASSMACRAISYGEARVDISPGVGGEEREEEGECGEEGRRR
jgi:hypothetical protein